MSYMFLFLAFVFAVAVFKDESTRFVQNNTFLLLLLPPPPPPSPPPPLRPRNYAGYTSEKGMLCYIPSSEESGFP